MMSKTLNIPSFGAENNGFFYKLTKEAHKETTKQKGPKQVLWGWSSKRGEKVKKKNKGIE